MFSGLAKSQLTLGAALLALTAAPAIIRSQEKVTVEIDVGAGRHAIDPRIYGIAHAEAETLRDLRIAFHRWGGNVSTRHNWQMNASNRAGDWFFESIADGSAKAGESADNFIRQSKANGAEPSITIPTLGWVAKVSRDREKLGSFSVAK